MYDDYYLEQLARQRHDEIRREVEAARLAKTASSANPKADNSERRLAVGMDEKRQSCRNWPVGTRCSRSCAFPGSPLSG